MSGQLQKNSRLYLASSSPRRKELLTQLGYQFDILVPDIEEQQQPSEPALDYVERLSRQKAQAGVALIANQSHTAQLLSAQSSLSAQASSTAQPSSSTLTVLGSDTIVVVDDKVLEKPRDFSDFSDMMAQLSNRKHQVMTSVTVANSSHYQTRTVITDVWFKALSEQDIIAYWNTGEPCDKAGGYGIQGIGGRFVSRIEGSFHAVMGLPLLETDELLQQPEFGIKPVLF